MQIRGSRRPPSPRGERAAAGTATASVLDSLRRIVRVLRESSRASEKTLGVSGAQLFVLKALTTTATSSLNDVAARTRTHQSTVSVVVAGLVRRGLVRRRISAEDGRRVDLGLTLKGRSVLDRAPLAAQERLVGALESVPLRERTTLARSLARLIAAMGLEDAPVSMFFEREPAMGPNRQGKQKRTS